MTNETTSQRDHPADKEEDKEKSRVRLSYDGREQHVTLYHVPHVPMEGVVNGCQWFGVTDGQPEFIPRYKPLPEQLEDEQLLPFFSGQGQSYKHVDFAAVEEGSFPSITIRSICGYNYTPKNYKAAAKFLERCGFVCCRSRRGKNNKFWELWWLAGDWTMAGPLKKFYEDISKKKSQLTKWKEVVNWLCDHSSFGTLDVCCQRAAMTMD